MSQTLRFIARLENLKEGERSRLRRLAGQPLDRTLQGFDLFTGLWWPLRATNQAAPRRETAWLVAKLYGSGWVPHVRLDSGSGPNLPAVLARCEPCDPPDFKARDRFRTRFDTLICSPLSGLEPHLRWALREVARAVQGRASHAPTFTGIDWARLLDDLSLWDRGYNPADTRQVHWLRAHAQAFHCGETHATPQDLWACEYLTQATRTLQGA